MRERESKMNNDILTFDAETAINKIRIWFTVLPLWRAQEIKKN